MGKQKRAHQPTIHFISMSPLSVTVLFLNGGGGGGRERSSTHHSLHLNATTICDCVISEWGGRIGGGGREGSSSQCHQSSQFAVLFTAICDSVITEWVKNLREGSSSQCHQHSSTHHSLHLSVTSVHQLTILFISVSPGHEFAVLFTAICDSVISEWVKILREGSSSQCHQRSSTHHSLHLSVTSVHQLTILFISVSPGHEFAVLFTAICDSVISEWVKNLREGSSSQCHQRSSTHHSLHLSVTSVHQLTILFISVSPGHEFAVLFTAICDSVISEWVKNLREGSSSQCHQRSSTHHSLHLSVTRAHQFAVLFTAIRDSVVSPGRVGVTLTMQDSYRLHQIPDAVCSSGTWHVLLKGRRQLPY